MPKLKKRKYQKKTEKKTQHLDVEPIVCKFLGIKEWRYSSAADSPVRYGRYHSSHFHNVERWGSRQWVVGTYIVVDYESLRGEGKSNDEIIQGCIKFLNQPPVRRKFQRKVGKSAYGNLQQIPVSYSFINVDGQDCISALIATDKRRSKKFWGEGIKL